MFYSLTEHDMTLMLHRYAVDLVVCVALGCDMFDCVFPTRTAVSSLDHRSQKKDLAVNTSQSNDNFDIYVPSLTEVWLCLGALGISPGKTQTVCEGHSGNRPRLSLSHLQEVSEGILALEIRDEICRVNL